MSSRELLEKAIARILHRHCNFGWAHYYIPSEKFPSLIEELVEVVSPAGQVSHEELVQFFLRTQRLSSAQEIVDESDITPCALCNDQPLLDGMRLCQDGSDMIEKLNPEIR